MPLGRRYVEAPNVPPLPFGLLSAAVTVNDSDPHLGMGLEYESLACSLAHITASECFTQAGDAPASLVGNTQDGTDLVDGDPFMVYALHTCRNTPGRDPVADAEARLNIGQSRAIEAGTAAGLLLGATDLTPTPGTAIGAAQAVSIIEQYAAETYGGPATLHVPRGVGTNLATQGVIERVSGRLETVQGTVVSSGGGYPTNATVATVEAQTGERWIWATGLVTVRLGPVAVSDAVQGLTTGAAMNEVQVLAQRPVVVTAECFSVGILVTALESGGGGASGITWALDDDGTPYYTP